MAPVSILARDYARQYHGDISRLDEVAIVAEFHSFELENYEKHFDSSAEKLEEVIAIVYLKDIPFNLLEETFGIWTSSMVHSLEIGPGNNRKEKNLNTYWKIRKHIVAVFVKLCERIIDVISARGTMDEFMFRKEHDEFKAALWQPNELESLWQKLNDVTFPKREIT